MMYMRLGHYDIEHIETLNNNKHYPLWISESPTKGVPRSPT